MTSQANSARASPAPTQQQAAPSYQFAYPYTAASSAGTSTSQTTGAAGPYYQYPSSYWYQYGSYAQQPQKPGVSTAGTSTPQSAQRQFNYYTGSGAATSGASTTATTGTTTNTTTGTGRGAGRKSASLKGLFHKDLRNLMYGFGDDRNPANDTVNVMEEILIEYITDVCTNATAGGSRKPRLGIEDLRKALSRPADAKKLARMEELLFMQEDIKRARALVDNEKNIREGDW